MDKLAEPFIEAGWLEWDMDHAYDVIETALDYMDENDSL